MAEFALVLPVLLMILFGIIEFGLMFSRAQAIEAAAREGARLASLSSTTYVEVMERVDATLAAAVFDATPTVVMSPTIGCFGREGESVTVTVTAPHQITIPFVFDHSVMLTGQAVFRCEA
ncbi:MAG: pilus assembly protein [Actinomycetia bacterium]|nr:pilus assembly protein [Actinomycetes bacterium]MCP4226825.1 pilus assembly protein [Actinomycetes bacterium]MCP5030550.1 pilus assembly protein [Actinomycetes bacterium]